MSKIQDALLKLKKDLPAPAIRTQTEVTRPTLANLVEEVDETGMRIQADDGGLIVVDHVSLRNAGYFAPMDQQRHIAEQYRILKRPLLDNATGQGAYMGDDANLIMVTSALPGDGKTFNCINLALSMAIEKDNSVLLVDADVAKRHTSELLGVADQPGLTDLLKDHSADINKFVLRTDIPGLRVLPAGSLDEQSTELLASNRMHEVIRLISKTYSDRVAIFDSPPILVTSEARVLASFMGQIAMVVCAGVTPQNAVLEALDKLDDSKAINLILNQSAFGSVIDGYGQYGYGYGQSVYGN